MICPNCGNNLDDNAKFCVKCGSSLDALKQGMAQQIPNVATNNVMPTNSDKKYKILSAVLAAGFIFMVALYVQSVNKYNSLSAQYANDIDSIYNQYKSLENDYNSVVDENDDLRGNNGIGSWFNEFFD